MFVEGTYFLESIAREVEPDYKIVAFRAGGWAILPFSKMKDGFVKAGIKVDSSVMQGVVIESNGMRLDYSGSPHKGLYRFTDDVLKEENNGLFVESQICSYRSNLFTYIYCSIWHHLHHDITKVLTDGSHYRSSKNQIDTNRKIVRKSRREQIHSLQAFGLTGLPPYILRYQIKRCQQPVVVLISHPKDLSQLLLESIRGLKGHVGFESYQLVVNI